MGILFRLGILVGCLLAPSIAAGDAPARAPEYLSPLGANGLDLFAGYSDFLAKVDTKGYYEESAIYVGTGLYLGVFQKDDTDEYYLIYAKDTKPKITISTMLVPEDFAKGVSDKLADIIQRRTGYAAGLGRFECTDSIDYVFESAGMYGVATCQAAHLGGHLDDIADKLMDLASRKSLSDDEKNKRMAEILSLLAAAEK